MILFKLTSSISALSSSITASGGIDGFCRIHSHLRVYFQLLTVRNGPSLKAFHVRFCSSKDPQTVLEDDGDPVRDVLPMVCQPGRIGSQSSSLVHLWPFSCIPWLIHMVFFVDDEVYRHLGITRRALLGTWNCSFNMPTRISHPRSSPRRRCSLLTEAPPASPRAEHGLFLPPECLRLSHQARVQRRIVRCECHGEEEGLFGWIAINCLIDGFAGRHKDARTMYGFLGMGGASTQIAFEPAEEDVMGNEGALVDVRLKLLGGTQIEHKVFVTTWLGSGTNQVRERYVAEVVQRAATCDDGVDSDSGVDTVCRLILSWPSTS